MQSLQNRKITLSQLDFYGLAEVSVTQLWNGDVQLVNAIEYVNWEDPEIQVLICEGCGIFGCNSGGWVGVRRTDTMAIVMPSFTALEESSEFFKQEYAPPHYLVSRGVIGVDREYYTNVLCQMAPFPAFETLRRLSAWEVLKIVQLEATDSVPGDLFYPPKFQSDIIIASSEGNCIDQTKVLASFLDELSTSNRVANLHSIRESDRVISFYLDRVGFPEWNVLSYNGQRYALYLEPGYVVKVNSTANIQFET